MRITEIFKTIQCEGRLTGKVSVLVRLAGCNLCCKWCDEKFSSDISRGYEISLYELMEKIKKYDCKNIIITGGEPLLANETAELTEELKKNNFHITVETNGTIMRKIEADLVSISPKLSHSEPMMDVGQSESYKRKRINIDVLKYYITNYDYQLKFVVKGEEDFEEIEQILAELNINDKSEILIMPLASTRKQLFNIQEKIVALCIQKGYRFANRLQLQIWGENNENKNNK